MVYVLIMVVADSKCVDYDVLILCVDHDVLILCVDHGAFVDS